jgi:hypothetical protein
VTSYYYLRKKDKESIILMLIITTLWHASYLKIDRKLRFSTMNITRLKLPLRIILGFLSGILDRREVIREAIWKL